MIFTHEYLTNRTPYTSKENYGFTFPQEDPRYATLYQHWKPEGHAKIESQRRRWKVLEKKQFFQLYIDKPEEARRVVKKLARKGIPPEFRGKVFFPRMIV